MSISAVLRGLRARGDLDSRRSARLLAGGSTSGEVPSAWPRRLGSGSDSLRSPRRKPAGQVQRGLLSPPTTWNGAFFSRIPRVPDAVFVAGARDAAQGGSRERAVRRFGPCWKRHGSPSRRRKWRPSRSKRPPRVRWWATRPSAKPASRTTVRRRDVHESRRPPQELAVQKAPRIGRRAVRARRRRPESGSHVAVFAPSRRCFAH